jgi:predicted outer membrane repeat protein
MVTTSLDVPETPGTLRDAINQANEDGTQGIADDILFEPSLNGDHFLLQGGPLELTAGASVSIWTNDIYSPGTQLQITLNGDANNIFLVDQGASLSLHELTLAGGVANDFNGANGGAIDNAGTLGINICNFVDNSAMGLGGAIYNTGTVTGDSTSTFTGNSALQGGAFANSSGGTVSLFANFSNNSASGIDGGAISNTGVMSLSGSLAENKSQDNGGAIYNDGSMTVTDSSLAGNTDQGNGGAIYNDQNGTMTVIQSTLANNSAPAGGAIENGGAMTLTADTVSGNSAQFGGGITTQSSLTLVDTIVADNTLTSKSGADPDIDGGVNASSNYDLIGNGIGQSGLQNGVNKNQVGSPNAPINPKLASLDSNGLMALSPGSPAIDAGGAVTTLADGIGTADTVIPVHDAAVFASTPADISIRIDGEQMLVTDVDMTNNTVTVARGLGADVATSHSASAAIYLSQTFGNTPLPPVSIGADQTVAAGSAVKFSVTGPTSQGEVSGITFTATITALDTNDNIATSYNGPVALTCSDGKMTTLTVTLTNGVGTAAVTLDKAEKADTLTASDGKIKGTSSAFPLYAGSLAYLKITAPSTAVAGVVFNTTITGTDWFGNPVNAGITLTSSDDEVNAIAILSDGKAVVSVKLDGAHTVQLTASALLNGTITATSNTIAVSPAAAASLTVDVPSSVQAGQPFNVDIVAADAFGNGVQYAGTVTLASSDHQKVTAGPIHFATDGIAVVLVTLDKADTITLKATGSTLIYAGSHIVGIKYIYSPNSNSITVNPGKGVKVVVSAPSAVPLDVTDPFRITVEDQYNNVADYEASFEVTFLASPTSLINNLQGTGYVFVQNGKGSGTLTPEAAGTFTLGAADDNTIPSLSGTSNPIKVAPDWFSNNISDPGIQSLARTDFYDNSPHAISFNDMLGIFSLAESELTTLAGQETNTRPNTATEKEDLVQFSLQTLAKDGSLLNMTAQVEYLTTQVAIPSTNDVGFLAYYYSQNPESTIPTITTGQGAFFGVSDGPQGIAEDAQLTALVNQWFNGTVYPSTTVSGGAYNGDVTPPYSVAGGSNISPTLYGPAGIPLVTDVVQGSLGDCWLLATLADVAYHDPSLIENMFTVNDNGTYTIHLYKLYPSGPHNATSVYPVYVTVDDELPTETGGFTISSGQSYSDGTPNGAPDFAGVTNGALWVALIEKAAAQLCGPGSRTSYMGYSYQALSGDNATPPLSIPGSTPNPLNYYAGDSMYSLMEITGLSSEIWAPALTGLKATPVINELNDNELTVLGSPPSLLNGTSWLVNAHEYAVLSYNPSSNEFLLYNPWGLQCIWDTSTPVIASSSPTTIQINDTQGIASGDVVQIDSEEMLVTGVGNDTITVQRGYDGTIPAAHNANTPLDLSFRNGSIPDAYGNQPGSPFAGTAIPALGLEGNNVVYGLFTLSGNDMSDFLDREDTTESYGASSYTTGTPSVNLGNDSTAVTTIDLTPQTESHRVNTVKSRWNVAMAHATVNSAAMTIVGDSNTAVPETALLTPWMLKENDGTFEPSLLPVPPPMVGPVATEIVSTLPAITNHQIEMSVTEAENLTVVDGESDQLPVSANA